MKKSKSFIKFCKKVSKNIEIGKEKHKVYLENIELQNLEIKALKQK